ncbi:BatD family protein [Puniceicoccaceae bacterium K14]|nr:BatD family protein [Puniceicoccaceae bacterium K14]
MNRYKILFVALCLGLVSALHAQTIYWSPPSGTLQRGKTNTLQLIFEGCSLQGQNNSIPQAPGLQLEQAGTSQNTQIVNGRTTRQIIVNFRAVPGPTESVTIPPFELETDQGKIKIAAAKYDIVDATIGNTGIKPEDVFSSSILANDRKIYQGELFDILYQFDIKKGVQVKGVDSPEWTPQTIITSGFGDFEQKNVRNGSDTYTRLEYQQVAMATESGELNLPSANQLVSVVTGRRNNFSFFGNDDVDNLTISSKPVTLKVLPLPENAPDTFYGAVGEFELKSTIVPQEVQIGEPVTWTLSLSGKGNWPSGLTLPARSVSNSFRAIQPEVKTEFEEGNLFVGTHTEDIVLIPTEEGSFQLGPLEYSYFDPKLEQYETIRIAPVTVEVAAVAVQAIDPNAITNQEDNSPSGPAKRETPLTTVELDPSGVNMLTKTIDLPADAISGAQRPVPAPKGKLNALNLIWTPIPALAIWILIALGRAFYFDKNAAQRKALSVLKSTKATEISNPEAQERWRHSTSVYWNLSAKEPSASELEAAVRAKLGAEQAELWKSLWLRSDSLLYGKAKDLGSNWMDDFKTALTKAKPPAPSLAAFGRSIAWKASMIAVAALTLGFSLQSTYADGNETAIDAYEKGDFSGAAKSWNEHLESTPGDWAALHNIGLAHAQQNDWGKALGYWTSAFVLQPQNESIRWNLKLALNRSGSFDPKLTERLSDKRTSKFATRLSPTAWENLAQNALVAITFIFLLIIVSFYLMPLGKVRWALWALAALCALFVVLGDWSVKSYGILANSEALILTKAQSFKSLPTDVEVEQIETPLNEGAIGIAIKKRFGWTQIELPNGEIGWLRSEALMPLYSQSK